MPFIQSVYCASVLTSSRGSACAANVASGAQNARQTSHPRPASQAAKKASATLVIDAIPSSCSRCVRIIHLALEGTAAPICGKKSASQATSMTCRHLDLTNVRRFRRRDTGEGFALHDGVPLSLVVG